MCGERTWRAVTPICSPSACRSANDGIVTSWKISSSCRSSSGLIDQRGAESLARLADLPLRWISGKASDMGSSAAKSPPPKILSMLCQRGDER